jgi:hypothetical protein
MDGEVAPGDSGTGCMPGGTAGIIDPVAGPKTGVIGRTQRLIVAFHVNPVGQVNSLALFM